MLKVVCNEKGRGAGKVANVCKRSRTVAIEVCVSFNFAVVFDFNLFLVPPSKVHFIGNVHMNRLHAAIRSMVFSPLYCVFPIDAPNHLA
jgi:hypothetical protein